MSLDRKFNALDNMTDKQLRELERILKAQYRTSLSEVQAEIAKVYVKYGTRGFLTYSEMQKYNRLSSLEKNLIEHLNSLYKNVSKEMFTSLGNTFSDAYLYTGFALETEAQVKLAYALIPKKAIVEAIQTPLSGIKLSERLSTNRKQIILKTREQLVQGLIQGESINKVSRRLTEVYHGDYKKSQRIARTENNRIRNQATVDSYDHAENNGLEFKRVWLATLDSRTRDTHKKLDGQVANDKGYFQSGRYKAKAPGGFGVASEDINCRCTTRVQFDDVDEPKERRARDEDGKGIIIPYTTYPEWVKNRVKK